MQLDLDLSSNRPLRRRRSDSSFWGNLLHCRKAVSVTEFALILPVFTLMGMYGTEVAYMATVNMQMSQLASSTADNASRIGQTNNSAVTPTVSEQDIDAIMFGARSQGRYNNFEQNGRLILTSLEVHPGSGKQWIHWQRCTGSLQRTSAYGNDTTQNGVNGAVLSGMGQGNTITAESGKAVMYVEVYYRYSGLFGRMFVNNPIFRKEAAFIVRDNRNLLQTGSGVSGSGGTSACS